MKISLTYFDFDDKNNPYLGAGQAKATYEVCSRLAQKGYAPVVYCSRYPGSKDRLEDGIYYKHIGLGTRWIRLNNFIYIILAPFYASHLSSDVIVECFTAPVSTIALPLFVKKIPVVAIPTSFEAERFSVKYHLPLYKLQDHFLKYYDYFLPYSQYYVGKMSKHNPDFDYQIVGQGADKEMFNIKPNKNAKHILFLGRLDIDQKGIDLLIEAYAKVQDKIGLPLIIAGVGPDDKKVKSLIDKFGLKLKVKVVGPAYGNKKIKLLKQSLFTAVPSRHEGFCIFALESLAAGVPVVTFDIPGLQWISSRVSLKASKVDSDEYSQVLLKAYKKYSKNKNSSMYKRFAQNYSWDNVAAKYDKYFRKVIKENE